MNPALFVVLYRDNVVGAARLSPGNQLQELLKDLKVCADRIREQML